MSRAIIHDLGFPSPQLQTIHHRGLGFIYRTDFEWPEYGLIGEYDGAGKYLKLDRRGTSDPGEAVASEKRREDYLRKETGYTFARWGTPELHSPSAIRKLLIGAGLPLINPAKLPKTSHAPN